MIKSGIKKGFEFVGLSISRLENKNKQDGIEDHKSYLQKTFIGSFDHLKHGFCFRGIDLIKNLDQVHGAKFFVENDLIKINIDGLSFYINSWEELFILNELYDVGSYNCSIETDFVFIDIGMNVGMTSLFFSKKKNCARIFAFEPFSKTIEKAKRNFNINPSSDKIEIRPYGLGYPERSIEVEYSDEYKGSVGINGVASYIVSDVKKETAVLEIKDVCHSLSDILLIDSKKILKIDCEGAEYEIIRRMHETDILKRIDVYMIEWHIKGPNEIKDVLSNNGFIVLSFNEKSKDVGFIYAFRNDE